jgi:putative FmdB family regulatory protein
VPVYGYRCNFCKTNEDRIVPVPRRDLQTCPKCGMHLARQVGAPRFRFAGVPTKGGGPDKFTADMLRIPLKDLPKGLKTK